MSSVPFATIYGGDINVQQGSDVTQFGWGDAYINRKVVVRGTEESTGQNSVGSLLVDGGARIGKSLNVMNTLNVLYGPTNLTETHVDTTNSAMTITGGNALSISVGASSQFVSTGGNLTVSSQTQSLQLTAGLNSSSAVNIQASNAVGGVSVLSGANGGVSVAAGSGGVSVSASNGNVSLTANNGSGNFSVNSVSNNQNLSIGLNGSTDSQLALTSSGTNASRTAIVINTTNTSGNIQISNANGLGSGATNVFVGSGGFNVLSNTSGPISLTTQAGSGSFTVQSSGPNQNLTLELNGETDSSVIIQSAGTNDTNPALQLQTTSLTGNIEITQPALATGRVRFYTGSGGFNVTTQTNGSVNMTSIGATSLYTNATLNDNQDLTVSVSGNTNSKVNILSSGNGSGAITLQTTNGTGGINVNSVGVVQIDSINPVLGVQIATGTSGIPVKIGTTTSTTTIMGNLDVKGATNTIESNVVTINDNIIVVNNAPSGTSDGGLAVKRYQPANNTGYGDVVAGTADESGTVQTGSNSTTTVKLSALANATDDYYRGWWIYITGGTGAGQVRRIKSYVGSTRVATVYSTADQTGVLNNVSPIEGLDFLTIPDNTSQYSLYPCEYVMTLWDETNDEFAFVCGSNNPSDNSNIVHYTNLHINDLLSNTVFANSINGASADITFTVTLNDANQVPVVFPSVSGNPMNAFPNVYGVYVVFVKPQSSTIRAHAIFVIGRINVSGIPGTVTRLISVKGAGNEHLDMQWPADAYPQINYRPNPIGGSGSTTYNVKVITL